ncbi:MAG TPA: hypothetical protein VD973_29455 [Symbiobacteriaceae bacterium]|nr:hypothetical protein [Symbiobacteriaceae bacterium]
MEARDQTSLNRIHDAWKSFNEVEQGALLVELSASLRRRLAHLEVDQDLAAAYRAFAQTARVTGNALIYKAGIPFVPDPPFRWSRVSQDAVDRRVPEIREWASASVVAQDQPLSVRHTALDLAEAGRELERQLERTRTR